MRNILTGLLTGALLATSGGAQQAANGGGQSRPEQAQRKQSKPGHTHLAPSDQIGQMSERQQKDGHQHQHRSGEHVAVGQAA